jgi:endonuclease III
MSNRAAKYEQIHKSLKKHFKTLPEPGERMVLEHLLYACCLEDARSEQADEAFAKLQQAYFDWNEVRVTTVVELGEALSSLPNATQAGHRIKRCLQSLFEARYQYDIEDMKKANLSKATEEISAWKGISPFVLNYVSQNALGGHAIPADTLTLEIMVQCEILTQAEAEKKSLPGVERAIPKNKGFEFASLLHQFAVEFHQNPKNAAVLAVFKELGVTPKPKAVEKPAPKKESKPVVVATLDSTPTLSQSKSKSAAAAPEPAKGARKPEPTSPPKKAEKGVAAASKPKDVPGKVEAKPETAKTPEPKKKSEAKAAEIKKPEVKKTVAKAEVKKPDEKPAVKKPEAKPEAKSTPKPPEKKPVVPAKAAKPVTATKKVEPTKKQPEATPKSSPVKPTTSASPTKKKPR